MFLNFSIHWFFFRIERALEGDWTEFSSKEKETLHFTRNPFGGNDQVGEIARRIIALYNVYCKSVTISLVDTKSMANNILDGRVKVVYITDVMRHNRETKPISSDVFSLLSEHSLSVPSSQQARIMSGAYIHNSTTVGNNVIVGIASIVSREAKIHDNVILCNHVIVPPKVEVKEYTMVTDEVDTENLVSMTKEFEERLDDFLLKDELQKKIDKLLRSNE